MGTNTKSVNSCKAQHERKWGKIKRVKDIRAEILQELKKEIQDIKETHALVVGDFNENVNAKNIQDFVVEIGFHGFFSEANEFDENNRNLKFEHGTKCIDYVLR